MSQTPTMGRIVHYRANGETAAVPAIVTKVHNATCVNLETFGFNKQWPTSVCEGNKDQAGAWWWPGQDTPSTGVKVESPQATLEFKTGPAANVDEPFPGGR